MWLSQYKVEAYYYPFDSPNERYKIQITSDIKEILYPTNNDLQFIGNYNNKKTVEPYFNLDNNDSNTEINSGSETPYIRALGNTSGVNDDEHVCLVVFEGTYTYVDVPPNNSSSDNFIKSDTFVPFTFTM